MNKYGQCLKTTPRWQHQKTSSICKWHDEDLVDSILKGHTDIVNLSEWELLGMIKQLAVITVSAVVLRSR